MAFQDDYREIIDATDIVSLVSSYNIKLDKQGKNYKGLCPFHHEDTPSFLVSPEKKLAHCFGCGGGGDPIKFIMQIENITFPEALRKLAEFNGMEIKTNYKPKEDPNKKYYEIMNMAINFYKANYEKTTNGKEARQYLLDRGLDDETISEFNIGLSPKSSNSLFKLLKDSNFLELDIYDVGLINIGENDSHDFFVNRIMFPIYNENGNPIGFSARMFNSNDPNQPKYVNSRETILYHKGEVLFNIQKAKGEMLKRKRVILHEGQMDVIASYKSGLKEAICTMGTALSLTQARLLSKYTNNAIICYDGDSAGIKASKKAIKIFEQAGFNVRLVLLPDGMDPDEYVKKFGKEAYVNYFESHIMDSLEYLYQTTLLNKNLDDNIIFKETCDEIFGLLLDVNNQAIKESYLKRLSDDTKTTLEAIRMDFDNYRMSFASTSNNSLYPADDYYIEEPIIEEPKPIISETWNSIAELRLFLYAMQSKANAIYINDTLGESIYGFKEKTIKIWVKLIDEYYANFDKFDNASFIKMLDQPDVDYYTLMMNKVREDTIASYNQEDMTDCIKKIRLDYFDAKNKDLKRKISSQNISKEKSFEYANEAFINRKRKLELSKKRGK